LLYRIADEAKRNEKIKSIEVQSDRMLKLLDDLLEMGQLDDKSVAFQFYKEAINPLIEIIISDFQSAAGAKQQTIEFFPDASLPATSVDAIKFSRAIMNIVQNAINYTPVGGKITLGTAVEDGQMVVSITDTGIGIAKDHLPHVFERFFRVDSARAPTTGGSGLGLPISKRIIEAHHGSITVESSLGKGTTFEVKLPLHIVEAEKTA
jgi:signal transduction histidine kinase